MTTSRPSPHLFSVPMALAVAAACVSTLVAAQQPAPPPEGVQDRTQIGLGPRGPFHAAVIIRSI